MNNVSRSVNRIDGVDKVTGTAKYAQDIVLPNMLFAKVLRSPHAHAEIESIDLAPALAMAGVVAAVCWHNTPRTLYNQCALQVTAAAGIVPVLDQYIFDNKVRFVGDEVAAVAAETEALAEAALARIRVKYRVLPAYLDPKDATAPDAVSIHPHCTETNLACSVSHVERGDFDAAWAACDVTFEGDVKLPIQKPLPMETHSAVADYSAAGDLTIYSCTQAVHPARIIVANVLGLPASRVRVLNPPYVGGGFGCRGGLSGKAELIAAVLSMQAGRPVKFVYTRREDLLTTETRHSGYVYIRLGAMRDGTLHALQIDSLMNTGAYASWGSTIPLKVFTYPACVFHIPNMRHYGRCVYTNVMPAGAMRGFGNPQGMFAMEYAISAIARQLKLDPLEIYHKNIIRPGEPWVLDFPLEATRLGACIDRAAEEIGWKQKRGLPKQGRLRRGVGIGIGRHISMSSPASGVLLCLDTDGSVQLTTGASDIGNGIHTTLAQILSDALGVPLDAVHVAFGDTLSSPYDDGTHSTRCVYDRGLATINGAKELKRQILDFAAEHYCAARDGLTLEDGVIRALDGRTWTLKETVCAARGCLERFEAIGRAARSGAVPWHAHAVEIEVDTETGFIRVLKVVAVHDVGIAVNPMIVEGQIQGGVAQSLGYALSEEVRFRSDGTPEHSSMHSYLVPAAGDLPFIEPIIVESTDPNGPYGAKGIGESSFIPTVSAVADALYDATGIRMDEIPMTPERVLKKLKETGVRA